MSESIKIETPWGIALLYPLAEGGVCLKAGQPMNAPNCSPLTVNGIKYSVSASLQRAEHIGWEWCDNYANELYLNRSRNYGMIKYSESARRILLEGIPTAITKWVEANPEDSKAFEGMLKETDRECRARSKDIIQEKIARHKHEILVLEMELEDLETGPLGYPV